jgi:FAD/FMN-containing dehydrogenase
MTINLAGLNGETVEISADSLQSFKSVFKGQLLTSDDAGYEELRKVWNAMIDRRPGLIARCTGTADVVQAVRFARQHGLLSSVRGGGHNIAGLAVCEAGLMIDMSALRGVWVDAKQHVVHAQAGCILGDVDRETQLHGMAAVLGFVSATGIAGLTVGGGFGYLTRSHGWTCDTLRSMEVITADARVLHVSETENADLFWALRGGGGNFGIVTSFEYKLVPVGPEILGGAIAWHGKDAKTILNTYREFSAKAPRELTSVAVLRNAPPAPWLPKEVHGKPIVALFICYNGKIEDGEALLKPLRQVIQPVADIVTRRPYTQMQSLLDATQPKGRRYYWKSHYLANIDDKAIDLAIEHASRIQSPHSAILFFQIQGALNECPDGYSPAGNRKAAYVLNITGSWESVEDDAVNVAWARECFEATRACSTVGTYINFLTEEEGRDRIEAAYSHADLQRLAKIKHAYDPDNLFRHTKNIVFKT